MLNMHIGNDELEPIVDSLRMKELLRGTSDKRGKIARMIHGGDLIQLRRGLYATRRDLDPLVLATSIYGPSYVSFETALWYHGMIPEAVFEIVSATVRALAYPQAGTPATNDTRRVFLKDFPFAVVYRPDTDGITIFALAHHSRRPGYWRSRVKDR